MTTAYPLSWPDSVPRCIRREKSQLKASLSSALKNVHDSLRKFGADSRKPVAGVVLSSNCALGVEHPEDPGVAVWFSWENQQLCIPVDRYTTPAENLQAIHYIIEARRTELRHGTLALVKASLQGFRALPSPPSRRTWREILGVSSSETDINQIRKAFRQKAVIHHPDKPGGSDEVMSELNAAMEAAEKELLP